MQPHRWLAQQVVQGYIELSYSIILSSEIYVDDLHEPLRNVRVLWWAVEVLDVSDLAWVGSVEPQRMGMSMMTKTAYLVLKFPATVHACAVVWLQMCAGRN